MENMAGVSDQQWNITDAIIHTPPRQERKEYQTQKNFPRKINMPQMSSMDATYHVTKYLIYAIHNPSPAITLVELGNGHTE